MTTAAAPNQLPESLFSPEHEGQVSAPLSPESAPEDAAPEGAAPDAGMTEEGLPQMPPDQLQQALAQQFQQAPEEAAAAPQPEAAAPAEPVAPAPAETLAQMPAEQAAPMPAEPVQQALAEASAQPQAEAVPVEPVPAEPLAQMPAEQAAYVPQELGAEHPVTQMQEMAGETKQPAAAQPEAAPVQAEMNGHAVAAPEAMPQEAAPQAVGMDPVAAAAYAEAAASVPEQAPEAPETVLAAMPHPDTYQQLPPASANAEQVIPGLAPEAQDQLQAAARYVPNEVAMPAAMAPEAAEMAQPAPEMAAAEPIQQPAAAGVGIPDALEALSQPVAGEAVPQQMPEMAAPAAVQQPEGMPADPAMAMAEAPQMAADPMMAAGAEAAVMPELAAAPDAQAAQDAPQENAHLAPEAAGVALATDIPAITELPPAGTTETPLVLGSDLRQLSTVSAEAQTKGGLSGLFSRNQDAETPAPASARVSVLGANEGTEKKKGFSLSGLFSRKKKDDAALPREIFAGQPAAQAAAAPVNGQAAPAATAAAMTAMPAEDAGPVREEIMLFAGKNAEDFAESWDKYREAGGKLQASWSTPAFLLSFVWLAYRKLHKFALGGFALVAGLTLVHAYAALAALVVVMLGVGLFGKSLYAQMMGKKIVEIMQAAGDPNNYVDNLRVQGGVSLPAALCLGVLSVVVVATMVLPKVL